MSIFQKKCFKNWKLASLRQNYVHVWIVGRTLFLILLTSLDPWIKLCLAVVMGIGMAGVGMNVMHDGNHGSFSRYDWVNKLMGASIYILAGNVHNWKVQHNILHHTYTNIQGHDEDLEAGRIIRFSKHSDWFSFHRFQHYYAVFFMDCLPSIG